MGLQMVYIDTSNYREVVKKRLPKMPSIEMIQWYEKKCSEDTCLRMLGVVTAEGTLVGHAAYASGAWDPVLAPGYAEISIIIADAWKNEGLDDWLYQAIKHIAREDQAYALQMIIEETDTSVFDWSRNKGFTFVGETFTSYLDVHTCNLQTYDPLVQKMTAEGIHFKTLATVPREAERFWNLWWELVCDVPGMENKPRPNIEELMKQVQTIDKEGFIIAVDGDAWVGLSMIIPETDETFYNSMTGVVRSYRGRGIARALKVQAIEYALTEGASGIRTHNDAVNTPMLSINQDFGYVREPGLLRVVQKL